MLVCIASALLGYTFRELRLHETFIQLAVRPKFLHADANDASGTSLYRLRSFRKNVWVESDRYYYHPSFPNSNYNDDDDMYDRKEHPHC